MADTLTVMRGSTFLVSDERGDVFARVAEGLFVADVRHLSLWQLCVNGAPMRLLSSRTLGYGRARIFGTLGDARIGHSPPVSISRDRRVLEDVREHLRIESHSRRHQELEVDIRIGSDFIDIFEARRNDPPDEPAADGSAVEHDGEKVRLIHRQERFSRATEVAFDAPFELAGDRVGFRVSLPPRARWDLSISISCAGDGVGRAPGARRSGARGARGPDRRVERSLASAPTLETDSDTIERTYAQSIADLGALTLPPGDADGAGVPAAGLPWFMALFGRDSLITAYQALPFLPGLARATLRSLAALQADADDGFRDAEPGKILHELRRGKLATLGEIPHTPYYGTHDATPLFLVVLDEYERWTGDDELVRELERAARAALGWIEHHGDLDGDGYLEYRRRSPLGLHNQCWKDSRESMAFADGAPARHPLAACEIQGYAYDARRRMARLCRTVWNDPALGDRLERDAEVLKRRFNRDFWSTSRAHYVLALDADKRQVDSLTSNVGHLLWSGIVDAGRARAVVERLMADDVYNGWGLRTMSSGDGAYNPIGYHLGTVWPHDTGIAAEGMRRCGFEGEAFRLVESLLDAASFFGHRLPEVFAGFDRSETGTPVEYPTASRPQAWAAGAALLALRTLLGIDVEGDRVRCAPISASAGARLKLRNLRFRNELLDVPETP